MPKYALLALAAALLPVLAAAAARADGTSAFGAADAAQLRGYTASPAQIYVPAGGPSAGPAAPAPRRPKAPARSR
ncbi:hypothetical protein ACLBXO_05200 [Methylobacterium sp. C33D]